MQSVNTPFIALSLPPGTMAFSARLVAILLLVGFYPEAFAAPSQGFRPNTHNVHVIGRGVELNTFHPASTFEVRVNYTLYNYSLQPIARHLARG